MLTGENPNASYRKQEQPEEYNDRAKEWLASKCKFHEIIGRYGAGEKVSS